MCGLAPSRAPSNQDSVMQSWSKAAVSTIRPPKSSSPSPALCTTPGTAREYDAVRIVPWIDPVFRDREAAGRALGETVARLALSDPVVVGVARGGVAVAAEVARALDAPLT